MIDIQEIVINKKSVCIFCGSNIILREFIKECQRQKIVFKKAGYIEDINYQYFKLGQDTAIIVYSEYLNKGYELQFYSRKKSDYYGDWDKFHHINYLEILREDKLNQILN